MNGFYERAKDYWSKVPSTIDGVLGGFGYLNDIDIKDSSDFLQDIGFKSNLYALDCGAGIGRVTKHLLMPRFATVDLVEQNPSFAAEAKNYCTTDDGGSLNYTNRFGEVYNLGLQHFSPIEKRYDLIWCQWVMSHLLEEDLLEVFKRLKKGLTPEGFFVIKDNVSFTQNTDLNLAHYSFMRPLEMYEALLGSAGFRVVKIKQQQYFPCKLYPVYSLACQIAEPQMNVDVCTCA